MSESEDKKACLFDFLDLYDVVYFLPSDIDLDWDELDDLLDFLDFDCLVWFDLEGDWELELDFLFYFRDFDLLVRCNLDLEGVWELELDVELEEWCLLLCPFHFLTSCVSLMRSRMWTWWSWTGSLGWFKIWPWPSVRLNLSIFQNGFLWMSCNWPWPWPWWLSVLPHHLSFGMMSCSQCWTWSNWLWWWPWTWPWICSRPFLRLFYFSFMVPHQTWPRPRPWRTSVFLHNLSIRFFEWCQDLDFDPDDDLE